MQYYWLRAMLSAPLKIILCWISKWE